MKSKLSIKFEFPQSSNFPF